MQKCLSLLKELQINTVITQYLSKDWHLSISKACESVMSINEKSLKNQSKRYILPCQYTTKKLFFISIVFTALLFVHCSYQPWKITRHMCEVLKKQSDNQMGSLSLFLKNNESPVLPWSLGDSHVYWVNKNFLVYMKLHLFVELISIIVVIWFFYLSFLMLFDGNKKKQFQYYILDICFLQVVSEFVY